MRAHLRFVWLLLNKTKKGPFELLQLHPYWEKILPTCIFSSLFLSNQTASQQMNKSIELNFQVGDTRHHFLSNLVFSKKIECLIKLHVLWFPGRHILLYHTWRDSNIDEKKNDNERNIKVGERSCYTSV